MYATIVVKYNKDYASAAKVGDIKWSCCPSVRLSVCSIPLPQKRCALELRLLYTTNRKPHAGSRTHRSSWPCDHQKWPKRPRGRKHYVVNISKSKQDRALLNVNRNHRPPLIGRCRTYRLITGKDQNCHPAEAHRFAVIGAMLVFSGSISTTANPGCKVALLNVKCVGNTALSIRPLNSCGVAVLTNKC